MEYRQIAGVNKPISQLVQGTSITGFKEPDRAFTLLDAVFELGCTTIDTAHGYGNGIAERLLGQWLAQRGLREQIAIITKGAHPNQDRKRVTPFDITADLHDSLARLKTDYIDLYMLHRDDPDLPVGPIVDILNEHHRAGKILAFGGSNWTHRRIQEANAYARQRGLTPFTISSPNFSLAEQVQEPWPGCVSISGATGEAARAWYAQNQMPLFTWSSLAIGFFSGRFSRANLHTFEDHYDQVCVKAYGYEENFKRLDRVEQLAREKEAAIPQIALAYVLNQPLNIFALVGCNTPDEFRSNLKASQLKLSPQEIAWLELNSD